MNIGLIDADLLDNGTRHPNLALLKISGFNKGIGNQVSLLLNYQDIPNYDKVFISKVFSFTKVPKHLDKYENIEIGGTGFFEDGGKDLPNEIEHHMPDYHLYDNYLNHAISLGRKPLSFKDYTQYSIGFTTRGCFRKCGFCVNKKYDHVFRHSPVSEFLDNSRPGIYLWDDNFLGYPKWVEILDELESTGKYFQFRQGLDIRLLNVNKAKRLSKVKYNGDFIFAFDHIEDEEEIRRGLSIWRNYSNKSTKLYVLCAFDSQDYVDITNTFKRIKILMEYGCIPYIMRYESYKQSRYKDLYIQIARWCNQPQFYKKMSFREFCEANQKYTKTELLCSSMVALNKFENDYPDIANTYFDMKFEKEKDYATFFL